MAPQLAFSLFTPPETLGRNVRQGTWLASAEFLRVVGTPLTHTALAPEASCRTLSWVRYLVPPSRAAPWPIWGSCTQSRVAPVTAPCCSFNSERVRLPLSKL